MASRGLLISCAMLEAMRPTRASFSFSRSVSSARLRSYCRLRSSSAAFTQLTSVGTRIGRSSRTVLPSGRRCSCRNLLWRVDSPPVVKIRIGGSDHSGCSLRASVRTAMASFPRASSSISRAPIGWTRIAATAQVTFCSASLSMNAARRALWMSSASRPVGATSRTRKLSPVGILTFLALSLRHLNEFRNAGQYLPELLQRLSDLDAVLAEPQFADGILVRSAALLQHGNGPAHRGFHFKIAKNKQGVGQVADIDRLRPFAEEGLLRQDQKCVHALLVQERE